MSHSQHEKAVELHNQAAHAHQAAAASHNKGDHLTAHEHSAEALKHSNELLAKFKASKEL
jgi:hypothetical protein